MTAIPRIYNIVSSIAATVVRAGYGGKVLKDVNDFIPQGIMSVFKVLLQRSFLKSYDLSFLCAQKSERSLFNARP